MTNIYWKKSPLFKKNTKLNAFLPKKKQTNPLFEDEIRYEITFKCKDF